ncbi:MAG: Response regulator of zinc sigma-54-dependent two-component system [Ignavibacteriae bacterium]|nr:MAG: Response regulator of zinc sigma-54-dependent two-component system [Ignavibacteriota bacterium]
MELETLDILLVDDDPVYVNSARHHLSKYPSKKFNLIWKDNGDAAIQELKSNPNIKLVLIDYYLPDKDGLEIVKEIANAKISIPIIFLTTHKNFKLAVEAMKLNVEDYLIKEETVDTMLPRAIVTVLERFKIKKQLENAEKEKIISEGKANAIKELIVTISHEFNNPLAAIKISTDILAKQNLSPESKKILEELVENLKKIENEISILKNLDISD